MTDIRIVLVGTQHPGNIGSAARAMKTMGLSKLVLVAPEAQFPHPETTALAAGADDVLAEAAIHDTLATAIGDCRLVLGCTARSRTVRLDELAPRDAARKLDETAMDGPVALVFGRERTGLSNDELFLCHAAVHIPANPDFSSLNLAAAVQVMAYELRLAALEAGERPSSDESGNRLEAAATSADMEGLFAHLGQALDDIDFHKGRAPDMVMRRLRRLFLRAGLDRREVRILRGIFTEAQRMAGLARGMR
jgi:tRNA (cytidine32/uridine32-2'-O)-methyltransferase